MSQTKSKFGCCDRLGPAPHSLVCKLCKYKYHLSCVNIQKSFKELTEEYKSNWLCPCCHSKIPKIDNTNTPIRAVHRQTTLSEQEKLSQNVNTKRGGRIEKISSLESESTISIRSIVREELENILDNFKINILNQFDRKLKELVDSFKRVSDSLSAIEKQQEITKQEVQSNTSQIKLLESENASLRSSIAELNSRLTLTEQHSRATNLLIQNIPEHKSENLITIAKQIAATVNYKLNESDIHVCTRVTKVNRDSPRPRSVIVKFSSPRIRDEFLAASLRFNKRANSVSEKLNSSHLGLGGQYTQLHVSRVRN
ncbi:unnamed protein product [Parnassius apollo]|uniref:(apollo) hypothetical protein n=1 Tax=Parnassius apollo TaxID=110799 RepID=A0A8S3W0B0_PARAO|nr:unnamed protein product [Parnassius apollo]